VQHAHQKGVVHRDLKPSNVLVELVDGKPVPKLIDFGISKAVNRALTDKRVFTKHGVLLGTPAYSSPEQASLSTAMVDTRTDVYSLGVLLFELLVGALPFEEEVLMDRGYDEMCRVVREQEPPTLSTKLDSLGSGAVRVAQNRRTDVSGLAKQLRGDLEWITMKALEKDPSRRYSSASGFSSDIRRHLGDEPISARPPSKLYLFGKFFRKNRLWFGSAITLLVVLLAGFATSTILYFKAETARKNAEVEVRLSQAASSAVRAAITNDVKEYLEQSRELKALIRQQRGTGSREALSHLVNELAILGLMTDFEEPQRRFEELEVEALKMVERFDSGVAFDDLRLLADYFLNRDAALAQELYRRAQARGRSELPRDDPRLRVTAGALAELLVGLARDLSRDSPREAVPRYREVIGLLSENLPETQESIKVLETELASCLIDLALFSEAEEILTNQYKESVGDAGTGPTETLLRKLVDLYRTWQRSEKLAEFRLLLPKPEIVRIRDLGELKRPVGVWNLGEAFSTVYGGSVNLVFGNEFASGELLANSWRWTGAPRMLLPYTPEEAEFNRSRSTPPCADECGVSISLSPGPIVIDSSSGQAFVFYRKELTRPGEFDESLGSSLAVWESPAGSAKRPLLRPGLHDPTLLFQTPEPAFGSAAVVVGEELYAYASRWEYLRVPNLVARVPLVEALNRNSWRFFAGEGRWSRNWEDAVPVIDANHPFSVHWSEYLGKFLAVYSTPRKGKTVSIRTADKPEGPWSNPRQVLDCLLPLKTDNWNGPGMAHPALARQNGRIEYLTYHRKTRAFGGELRLLELTFR
jgi:hypothetical protein